MSVIQIAPTSYSRPAERPALPEAASFHDNDFLFDPITEIVSYENMYLFETRLSDLEKLIPEGTKCLRISEDKGLFGLGMQYFPGGQFEESPYPIQKVYALIVVEPETIISQDYS